MPARFELRLADSRLISKYGLFIWEAVNAHVTTSSKYPDTLQYRGDGVFMLAGEHNRRGIKAEHFSGKADLSSRVGARLLGGNGLASAKRICHHQLSFINRIANRREPLRGGD